MTPPSAAVIGAGLAGSEAAWQLAQRGVSVDLFEMRPVRSTPAHLTAHCAELVCSNSFGSTAPSKAPGLLKTEMETLGSLILEVASACAVPAGHALAVDRDNFAAAVTARLEAHPRIHLHREEVTILEQGRPVVVASGPLTSDRLAQAIQQATGHEHLYFFDAIAPIVEADSIDRTIAFRASRYDAGPDESPGDYLNCPMTRDEYEAFVSAILAAERIPLRDFEREDPRFFEGCLPIEVLAARGRDALAYGPMRPVGLIDPRTGRRPWANVQLRQDNAAATLFNLVGFQTNLKWGDQERVLRMIPGLAQAEFVRLGQMHRNTFINAPTLLKRTLQLRWRDDLLFAGQIVGAEGYMGNAATGLLAGWNAARLLAGQTPVTLPPTTMLGALCHYITSADPRAFQPMKANFGLLPPIEPHIRDKTRRLAAQVERATQSLKGLLHDLSGSPCHQV